MPYLAQKAAAALLIAVGAAAMMTTPAYAETVTPVVIDLKTIGRGMTQTVTVGNTSAQPLPVELIVHEMSFEGGGTQVSEEVSEDLLAFPPQALIAPGQSQEFRIQYLGDPALAASKHYYVTVAQLPVKAAEGAATIQLLYNFQVLVSVQPTGANPDLRVTSASIGADSAGKPVPVFNIANDSAGYGYLSNGRLRITAKDDTGKVVFASTMTGPEIQQTMGYGLVASGRSRSFTAPLVLPSSGGTVEAVFTEDRR